MATRYEEAINWLYGIQFFGVKLGLEVMEQLAAELRIPGAQQRIVHVAGTNGKGSVCAMMESICREGGYKTGLFTSPHLVSYCERIRVDGRNIPEDEAADRIFALRERVADWERHPTFFEFTTALALEYFRDMGVDVLFLETGLGGRLDATNIVRPTVSAITEIGLDHCEWLGDSHGAVAGEKAGIIKAGVPVVSSPQHPDAESVLRQTAVEMGSVFRMVGEITEGIEVGLVGEHQRWNAGVAVAALEAGRIEVSDSCIQRGLAKVRWPARFQLINGGKIVIDGAHNPPAARALAAAWGDRFNGEKAVVVFGAASRKDFKAVWNVIEPIAQHVVVTPFESGRARPVGELAEAIPMAEVAENPADALSRAEKRGGRILVTGSLFLAGEVLSLLEGEENHEPSDQ